MKKKILVDIDVVTVAKWDKGKNGDSGRKFISKAEKGQFHIVTPYSILDLISQWKHTRLAKEIKEFYEFYSQETISVINLDERIKETGINKEILTEDLRCYGIKNEDIILVIIASIFDADSLVTFNRKHLKNNEVKINHVLQKHGLRNIRIVSPDEI